MMSTGMESSIRLIFEQIRTGGDRNFGYLVGNGGVAMVVDPSYDPDRFVERARAQGMEIKFLANTHGHHDHTNGNARIQELTCARLVKESFKVGEVAVEIIPVPGHSPDHIAIYIPSEGVLMTGDHLFVGKIGGTVGEADARQQYESLHKLTDNLPPETTVWPGHDVGCRPSSTLGLEMRTNPFLLAPSFEAFLELKGNWASYKAKMGLL
jgi:hydroxyacylglutathione hydrolase